MVKLRYIKTMAKKDEENLTEKVTYLSPLGLLNFYADQNGVTRIEFAGNNDDDHGQLINKNAETGTVDGITHENSNLNESTESTENPHLQTCTRWFDQYFKDPSKLDEVEKPVLSLGSHGSKSFLAKVWQVLRKSSKVGEMIAYGKLAALAGSPKASQSVGQAMRRNPFPILVPCHRVIRSNAKIGNYSWLQGVATKKWLLDHEKKFVSGEKDNVKEA